MLNANSVEGLGECKGYENQMIYDVRALVEENVFWQETRVLLVNRLE